MIIKVLSENNSVSSEFRNEHGLSLYIEIGRRKILFDTGAGSVFLENAEKLGVKISDIDFAVLSHGHYDHGGGLKLFMEENKKAPVYVHPRAFERHYASAPYGMKYIGIDETLAKDKRIIMTGGKFLICDGIELFSNIAGHELVSGSNNILMEEKDGKIVKDAFGHEQNLIVSEGDTAALFTGCAHNGIVNIVNQYVSIKKRYPDYCLGGFHLSDPAGGKSENGSLIKKVGEFLYKTSSKCYTFHCTGTEGYRMLKDVMGDRIEYLAAGSILEI